MPELFARLYWFEGEAKIEDKQEAPADFWVCATSDDHALEQLREFGKSYGLRRLAVECKGCQTVEGIRLMIASSSPVLVAVDQALGRILLDGRGCVGLIHYPEAPHVLQ
jgi:hypothetical protein